MDIITKFKDYIKNIKPEDKIAVLYHGFCGDGLCSCVIIIKSLEKILKRKVDFHIHYESYEITEEIIKFFKDNKISKAIFVDISLDIKPEMIREAEKVSDLLIIDHHEYKTDLNSEKTVFVHADIIQKEIPSYQYPASKLAYDLFSELIDISEMDYIASLGLMLDMGHRGKLKNFLIKTMEKYNVEVNEDVFKTEFGYAATNIQLSKRFKDNIEEVFNIIYNSKSYKDILNNDSLLEYKRKINEEIKYWINNRDKAEKYGDLIFYLIESAYNISTTVSTILSFEYFKGKTIVVVRDSGENYLSISARDQNINVRTNDLLKAAAKDLTDCNVGGHAPASGGKIRKEDLNKFKENLIKAFKELSKSDFVS